MSTTSQNAPEEAEIQSKPSLEKYGSIILNAGFTQHARSVDDYLNTLDICLREKEVLRVLESFRREAGQEVYPSVRTLAERSKCSERRIRQITAHLVRLGILRKMARYAERSQVANGYDLELLYTKVAAWLEPQIAEALAAQEAEQYEAFVPLDIVDQSAQILAEELGEREPEDQRRCAQRLRQRWEKVAQSGDWEEFTDLVEHAAEQTQKRKCEQTRTGNTFIQLVPYFFSALDYAISRTRKAERRPVQQQRPVKQTSRTQEQSGQNDTSQSQSEDGPGMNTLRQRQAQRRRAERQGTSKEKASAEFTRRVEATALTFGDQQVKSSVQRAANLMADARLDEEAFFSLMQTAREITSQRKITKKNGGHFNRMPYFFTLLEEEVRKAILCQVGQ